MERLAHDFLTWCEAERGLAPQTVHVYRRSLRYFTAWLEATQGAVPPPAAIDVAVIRAYRDSQAGLASATRAQRLTALRACFGWAAREGRVPVAVAHLVALPKVAHRLPVVFSEGDVGRLFAALEGAGDELAPRDRALAACLYYTGIRGGELVGLDVLDVDLEAALLLIRHGKGGRERLVPLHAAVVTAVRGYLPLRAALRQVRRRPEPGEALFLAFTGQRLQHEAVARAMRRRAQAAGLTGRVHLHQFRHSTATHLLEHGAPIEDVSELLGHRNLNTTLIYRHTSRAKLRQSVGRLQLPEAS